MLLQLVAKLLAVCSDKLLTVDGHGISGVGWFDVVGRQGLKNETFRCLYQILKKTYTIHIKGINVEEYT